MIEKIQEFQKKYNMISPTDRIVAGVSGGADSVCLILVLKELQKKYGFSLSAVHIEHGIRGEESLRDAEFTESFCRKQNVPLEIFHVDAPAKAKKEKKTLEEAARELRYSIFRQVCSENDADKIAVAHHGGDCAETMLFHLSRGTGLRGLCGIPPVRGQIIRPLLCVTRQEIEAYLEERQQEYCIDSTNRELQYARNRLRTCVVPQLEQINPQAVSHMRSTADMLLEVCDFLDEAAWNEGKKGMIISRDRGGAITGIQMNRAVLESMPGVLQKNFLHQMLGLASGSRKDISAVHVGDLLELFSGRTGREVSFPGGIRAVCEYEYVRVYRQDISESRKEEVYTVKIPGKTVLPGGLTIRMRVFEYDGDSEKIPRKRYTKWLDYDKITETVLIRKRQSGDYFVTDRNGNRKKLKDFFINEKIPRLQRDRIWLLADGSHIIWSIGLRISEEYKITQKTEHILEVCVDGGETDYE